MAKFDYMYGCGVSTLNKNKIWLTNAAWVLSFFSLNFNLCGSTVINCLLSMFFCFFMFQHACHADDNEEKKLNRWAIQS